MHINIQRLRERGFSVDVLSDGNDRVMAIELSAFHPEGNSDIIRRVDMVLAKTREHFPELSDFSMDTITDDIMNALDKQIILANI